MSGFTLGPRQFNFMASRLQTNNGADDRDLHGWLSVPTAAGWAYYYESKLDLRAFNKDAGTALALVNVAIQESGPINGGTTNQEKPAYTTVIDMISSVKIPVERIATMYRDADDLELRAPGFLNNGPVGGFDWDAPENREYNSSQIIYGKWRLFVTDRNKTAAANKMMLGLLQAGEFGSGEVITAPHAYYYRICVQADDSHTLYIPPANCAAHAAIVDLPEYVELAQMARLGQR